VSCSMMSRCWVLQLDGISKSVLMVLADGCGDDGFCTLPSLDMIALRVGWPEAIVAAGLEELERLGVIVPLNRDGTDVQINADPVGCMRDSPRRRLNA
jgi:hypothetical protein